MSSKTRQPRRSRNKDSDGEYAGSRLRRQKDPRQTTLTQIDFVTKFSRASPDLDLEYEEDGALDYDTREQLRPSKRRRVLERASHSPQPTQSGEEVGGELFHVTSHSSPGPAKASLTSDPSRSEGLLAPLSPKFSNAVAAPAAQLDDRALMPPPTLPKTPAKRTRTFVPSSQSPETTPLSATKGEQMAAQVRRSPLKERSSNSATRDRRHGLIKPTNPFIRFAVADTFSSETGEEDDELTIVDKDAFKVQNDRVSVLDLGSPTAPWDSSPTLTDPETRRPPCPDKRLETSPNANKNVQEVVYVDSNSQAEPPSDSTPQRKTPTKSFSQATTQDPTQFNSLKGSDPQLPSLEGILSTSASQSPHAIRKRPKRVRIPPPQATTQLPTQFIDDDFVEDGGVGNTNSVPGSRRGEVTRVPSSQATTVIPSSDPLSESSPNRPHRPSGTKSSRTKTSKQRYSTKSTLAMPTSSQALDGWQWDGKDWTESQMLPESLMNFALPDLPMASQESMASLRNDEEAVVPVTPPRISTARIRGSKIKDNDSLDLQNRPRENEVSIKLEPNSTTCVTGSTAKKSTKRTYGRAGRSLRNLVKGEDE